MKRPVRISLVTALVAAWTLSTASTHVQAAAIDDGMPDQSSLDSAPNSQSQGNWSDLSGGASGRPYVNSKIMSFFNELLSLCQCSVGWFDIHVIRDVIAVIMLW